MLLLNARQISQKIERIAIQILERHDGDTEVFLLGVNNNGYRLAKRLLKCLEMNEPTIRFHLSQIKLNPKEPFSGEITLAIPMETLAGKFIIVIDDVANTGRTLYYALTPLMRVLPLKVEAVALVDRQHKSFPVSCDYVGMRLATTLEENIQVVLSDEEGSEGDAIHLL